ncbi:MAG: hypothetical protein K1X36_07280 [Pyrinomonadaceae bacterium]|nr:hypothetical protein [Pyrinomonadaceae bacterium]
MTKREQKRRSNTRNRNISPAGRLQLYVLMGIFVAILVTGFFFAARQHFASIDYGIRNSKLRKQLDDLETEKRRLLLAREVSVAPSQIKQAAKKLGIGSQDLNALQATSVNKASPGTTAETASAKGAISSGPQVPVVNASFAASAVKPAKQDKARKEEVPRPRVVTTAMVATR